MLVAHGIIVHWLIEQWRRVVNTFRTNAPDCLLIVQHKINYTPSNFIKRLAA